MHELLKKITRFIVSFINISVLLRKCSKKLCFGANFQPTVNATKNSILYVGRVLDTPLLKLSVYTFNMFSSLVF